MTTRETPPRHGAKDSALLVFAAVALLLLMLAAPASRDWLWTKFIDLTLDTLGWLGADIGPLTT